MTTWINCAGGSKRRMLLAVLLTIFSGNVFAQIQTNVPALKTVYANDFNIGCILSYRHVGFPSDSVVAGQSAVVDPNGGYLVKYHMNSMSPGNNMKLQYTVDLTTSAANYAVALGAARDSMNVHPVIRFNGDLIAQLNWARRQGFTFRGHNLVWHASAPTEFFRSGYITNGSRLSKDSMIIRMDNYIHEVFRIIHQGWPGLLSAMDVVNEAIDDGTGMVRTSGNEWYTTFGDSTYVMLAFQLSRKYTLLYGETQLKLYYNDYNTETVAKANGIVRLLTPIYQAGYLDGIGMQEHDANNSPAAADFITSYNKFYPICSEMSVTELDVTTGSATPSAAVLATQADQYGMLFKCFVERSYKSGRGKIISVSKDGLDDANTFKTGQSSSLWDSNDQCKPSFFAAADVGTNYNGLDSLIVAANWLDRYDYTPGSWAAVASALASAKSARDRNYSYTVSADTLLGQAINPLKTAIAGLVSNVFSQAPVLVPALLSPANNAASQPAIIVLLCNATSDADRWHWQVSATLTFSSLVVNDSTMDTVNVVGPLTAGTKYYFRVRGINPMGASNFSSADSFTVMTAPSVPVLYTPIVGATGQRIDTLLLKWHSASLASGYECQLSLSSSFSSLVVTKDSTADTTFRALSLNGLTKYYWRVRAYNIGGASAFSVTDSFTTTMQPALAPALVSPRSTTSESRLTTFVWRSSATATAYHMQIATDNAFLAVIRDTIVVDTTMILSTPLNATTIYYWHVCSRNAGGEGNYSSASHFTTGTLLAVSEFVKGVPKEFTLSQNYPNPFNPTTKISYQLPVNSTVTIKVYDLLGREVVTLFTGERQAGSYTASFNGAGFASGVYIYQMRAGNVVETKKLLLLK